MSILKVTAKIILISAALLFISGCGDGIDDKASVGSASPGTSRSPSTGGLAPPPPTAYSNIVPMIVGIGAAGTPNIATVSVTICVPGSMTQCQTIDNIQVDSQSTGLRILNSALNDQMENALTAMKVAGGQLAECKVFASGFTWGSIRTIDLKIGGEVASNIPINIIGDLPDASIPTSCAANGHSENTVSEFGANGVLGVSVKSHDCGVNCSADLEKYFVCAGGSCSATAVSLAQQVPNPITRFPVDNNGIIIKLDAIPDSGKTSVNGTLTFGIGTQLNNALTAAQKIYTVDANGDLPNSFYNGSKITAFLDSGAATFVLNDNTLSSCPESVGINFFCPETPQTRSVTLVGQKGETGVASFNISNAQTLFSAPGNYAFNNLGTEGAPGTIALGLPFFFGRTVYSGIDQTASGGPAPFIAF
ncbi:DUF3443 domain-containing protein [Burkholderia ubonensis]|uniref:DUF3443 domain-containing protein n=1 Tax=Burkholderia ubonensis TaxID=101571 RepID=UPI0008FD9FD0|nr:DUF3443 domain-containing protein [Burkholderia ubonensis]